MAVRELFKGPQLSITLKRLVHELIEHNKAFEQTCMIGIQPRGVFLARRLYEELLGLQPALALPYGELDVTFHRDDVRRHENVLLPQKTEIPFAIEGQRIILVDDVLFTGRTVRAALSALMDFGRPASVELLVLVDRRRQRHIPVEPNYTGIWVDTLASENVSVEWQEQSGTDSIRIESAHA
jgi:pyrimidine operon attenuation protein/uracil phosphoribosyltransferase